MFPCRAGGSATTFSSPSSSWNDAHRLHQSCCRVRTARTNTPFASKMTRAGSGKRSPAHITLLQYYQLVRCNMGCGVYRSLASPEDSNLHRMKSSFVCTHRHRHPTITRGSTRFEQQKPTLDLHGEDDIGLLTEIKYGLFFVVRSFLADHSQWNLTQHSVKDAMKPASTPLRKRGGFFCVLWWSRCWFRRFTRPGKTTVVQKGNVNHSTSALCYHEC